MVGPMSESSNAEELKLLKERLADIEAQLRRRRRFGIVAVGMLLCAGVVRAASATCPDGLPACFVANSPALASDINTDLSTLRDWIEMKSGGVDAGVNVVHTGNVRIQASTTPNATEAASANSPFFFSGPISDGQNNTTGVEFRHDNLTQGVGIGYNSIYACGTNPSVDLHLKAKGPIGGVYTMSPANFSSNVYVNGDFSVGSNSWGSGPSTPTGYVSMGSCTSEAISRCPNGQFVCGFRINHGCGVNWYDNTFEVECCAL